MHSHHVRLRRALWYTATCFIILAGLSAQPAHAQSYGAPYPYLHQGSTDIDERYRQQIDWVTAEGVVHVQSTSEGSGGNFAAWAHVAHDITIQPNAERVVISAMPRIREYHTRVRTRSTPSYTAANVSLQLVVWDAQDFAPGDAFTEIGHPVVSLADLQVNGAFEEPAGRQEWNVVRGVHETFHRAESSGTERWHVAVALHSWATSASGDANAGAEMEVPAIIVRQYDRAGRQLTGEPCDGSDYTMDFENIDDDASVWIGHGDSLGAHLFTVPFGTTRGMSLCNAMPVCGANRLVIKIGNGGWFNSGGSIILRKDGVEVWRHDSPLVLWGHAGYTWRGVLDFNLLEREAPIVVEDRYCHLATDCMY